ISYGWHCGRSPARTTGSQWTRAPCRPTCGQPTNHCLTAPCRVSSAPTRKPSASRVTPRPAPARVTWLRCSSVSLQPWPSAPESPAHQGLIAHMPKRTDIKSILILGAGPIVVGQACEFDYSGAQACKALREEGFRVILVNSNPATIMTDPAMADATYIEPIKWQTVARIIEKERPDA